MKTEYRQLRLTIFIPVLLLINILIVLLTCLKGWQLYLPVFFERLYYAAFINLILGLMAKVGNVQSRRDNLNVNYWIYHNKTSDQMFAEEMTNRSKGNLFTKGMVLTAVIMMIISMLFS